jgi:nucleotide-binding universal stress UspA family protein
MTAEPQVRLPRPLDAHHRAALVVGHDRFPESDHALDTAASLAGRLQAFVHVVHAVCLDDYPADPDAADWDEEAADVLDAQRRKVESLLQGRVPGWRYHTGRGDPVALLAAVADAHDALMIVLGTRGGGVTVALSRLLDQSVSRAVIRRQGRPVLVVPRTPRS